MTSPLIVIGHRNPDSDSICAAIGYAEVLRVRGHENVIAGAAGDLRPETRYILERFGVDAPELVSDVYPRIRDVMTSPVITARVDDSIAVVGQIALSLGLRPVPVVDGAGRLRGMIDSRDFARAFFSDLDPAFTGDLPLDLDAVVEALDGQVVVAYPDRHLRDRVRVGAMAVESMRQRLDPDILLVIGDRTDAQLAAIDAGVGVLIVTGDNPVDPSVIDRARQCRVTIITSPHHTYGTIRRIHMSVAIRHVMRADPISCNPDDLVDSLRSTVVSVRYVPVVDEAQRVVGIVTRGDLLRARRHRVVLVDHNERSQAVPGIEQAEIVAVIDHHRVADFQTTAPTLVRVEPVGACSTIVARIAEEGRVHLSPAIAGVLLGGIVADTLLFRSPTTTPEDRRIAQQLAQIADVDVDEYGRAILDIAGDVSQLTPDELVSMDFKEFVLDDVTFGVGVIETPNTARILARRAEVEEAMLRRQSARQYTSVLLALIDILQERTFLLVCGHAREVAEVFGVPLTDPGLVELSGVYSRKKQIVPLLGRIRDLIRDR